MQEAAEKTDWRVRHPRFDEFWASHSNMCWWWANKIANDFSINRDEVIGIMVLKLNRTLWLWDEDQTELTTYFHRGCHRFFQEHFLRYENDYRALQYKIRSAASQGRESVLKDIEVNYAFHEANDFYMYRCPEGDPDEIRELINTFDTPEDCWRFMTRSLDGRERFVFNKRYREGWTLEAISKPLQVTKERVRQIHNHALHHIRKKMQLVQSFSSMFE